MKKHFGLLAAALLLAALVTPLMVGGVRVQAKPVELAQSASGQLQFPVPNVSLTNYIVEDGWSAEITRSITWNDRVMAYTISVGRCRNCANPDGTAKHVLQPRSFLHDSPDGPDWEDDLIGGDVKGWATDAPLDILEGSTRAYPLYVAKGDCRTYIQADFGLSWRPYWGNYSSETPLGPFWPKGWVSFRCPTPTVSITPSPTATASPTSSITPSATPTASLTPTASATPTRTVSPTGSATPTATATTTATPTGEPTVTPSATVTPTEGPTQTATPTTTGEPSETPSATPTGTEVPTGTPTPTPTEGATPTATPTRPFTGDDCSRVSFIGQGFGEAYAKAYIRLYGSGDNWTPYVEEIRLPSGEIIRRQVVLPMIITSKEGYPGAEFRFCPPPGVIWEVKIVVWEANPRPCRVIIVWDLNSQTLRDYSVQDWFTTLVWGGHNTPLRDLHAVDVDNPEAGIYGLYNPDCGK